MNAHNDREIPAPAGTDEPEPGTSLWKDAWHRLWQNRLAVTGLVVLCCMTALAVLTPWIAPYSYDEQDLELTAAGPCARHWFGTDRLGRDLLTRVLYGGRVSLMVGIAATSVSLVVGVLYGAIAGFAGGRADTLMMRFVDILYALPYTVFVIILTVYFGRNLVLLFLAIGAVEWLTMARIVRGRVMSLKEKEFIEATTIMGLSRGRVLLRHLIPNALGPIIVYTTLTVPRVMLLEAFLSFLGLGVQAPMSSWGLLIQQGVETMEEFPWMLIFPSLALSITLFSLNFLGDGLRDALDPQSARS
ncbi:MAG: ABC transporter permease subunit [Candidatus Hydrogenedentes bacterium]|nr:ABC transporter permease subunit [Candidatus Hydrogenedentota bacterium]